MLGCLVAYGVTRANASKGTLRPLADTGHEVRSLLQRTQARADRTRNRVGEIRAGWYHGTLAETSEHVANALGSKWDEIVVAGFRASNAAWWQSWRYTLSVVPRFGALQSLTESGVVKALSGPIVSLRKSLCAGKRYFVWKRLQVKGWSHATRDTPSIRPKCGACTTAQGTTSKCTTTMPIYRQI